MADATVLVFVLQPRPSLCAVCAPCIHVVTVCSRSYVLEVPEAVKTSVTDETLTSQEKKKSANKAIKKVFEDR